MDLISTVIRQSGAAPEHIVSVTLGLAGGNRLTDKEKIIHFLRPSLPEHTIVSVYSDAETALLAGTWGKAGIVLVAGTGSIVHAVIPEWKLNIRLGGWGYLLGDEGSGFDIGRQALLAVTRSYDGTGERTALTRVIMELFSIDDPMQLIDLIYEQANARKMIAHLAKTVFVHAEQGDAVAVRIIEQAAASLGKLILSVVKKLHEADALHHQEQVISSLPLVLAGSLFKNENFRIELNRYLTSHHVNFQTTLLRTPPVLGACIMGLLDSGIAIEEYMRTNFIETMRTK